ncbi:MAG TPA: glutamyl-tRNA reductase [Gemmatimonadaceae bacterium]|nr:glutamyl-tRNA reductase [Gemmatimonadaceae bacterium]
MSAIIERLACPWSDGSPCPWRDDGGCDEGEVLSLDAARRRRGGIAHLEVMCVGISFHTAPIELREELCLEGDALSQSLARFGTERQSDPAGLRELAIVSTCNRLEFYAAAGPGTALAALREQFALATGMRDEMRAHLYELEGAEAVRHLCRVAAGLDSLVIGEAQILGQVADAYSRASAHETAGPVLSALFRSAIRAGRRARAETGIARNPATVSSVAVRLAAQALPALERAAVVVVGAGEMAAHTVAALHHRGSRDIRVVSRTREHAARLADRVGGRTLAFEHLRDALADVDVVISSTAAPHVLITRDMVEEAMRDRPERPLVIVDIALPRDVDPAAGQIPNVHLHDLDGLQRHVSQTIAERATEVPRAEAIVAEETAACVTELRRLDVAPVIGALRARTDEIRREALARAMRHFGHLEESDRARIEAFSEALLNKLLHEPMVRIRSEAGSGRAAELASAVSDLFGIGGAAGGER